MSAHPGPGPVVLSDTDHLRNLLGRYCGLIDAGDLEGVGRLFAHGGLAAGPLDAPAFVSGAEEVAAFYRSGLVLHDGSPRTKHLVLDTVFEEQREDGTVVARSSYVVLQQLGDGPVQTLIAGRYVDHFGRDGAGPWHFVRRHFTVELAGDLSNHWGGPT